MSEVSAGSTTEGGSTTVTRAEVCAAAIADGVRSASPRCVSTKAWICVISARRLVCGGTALSASSA